MKSDKKTRHRSYGGFEKSNTQTLRIILLLLITHTHIYKPHISRFVSAVALVANEGDDDYYYSANNECTFRTSAIVINYFYYTYIKTKIRISIVNGVDEDISSSHLQYLL